MTRYQVAIESQGRQKEAKESLFGGLLTKHQGKQDMTERPRRLKLTTKMKHHPIDLVRQNRLSSALLRLSKEQYWLIRLLHT